MKIKILTVLKLAGSIGLPETALRMEVEMRWSIRVGDMEWDHALVELARMGSILQGRDELTGDKRWTLIDTNR
jgi:hypothetical protein